MIQRVLDEENNNNNNSKMNNTIDKETEHERDNDDANSHIDNNNKENEYNIKTQCIPGSHEVIPSSSFYNNEDTMTSLEEILTISSNSNSNNMKTLEMTTPETFIVHIRTSINNTDIIFKIKRSWSPIGVDRFYQLIHDNYYNCAAFFRVVPGM